MTRDSMDLVCYKYDGWEPRLRAASPKRSWMEGTNERYAYRCLPLAIANAHGWEILGNTAFEAKWDGGEHIESVIIRPDAGYPEQRVPVSLFGYGTITFHIEGIFRTPEGWNLWVGGSPNSQKDAIQPLGGIIETDWSPYTFTMNWRFTRANQWVRFEENEPIAFIFPVQRGAVEQFTPRFERIEDHPDVRGQFEKWSESRNAFQKWVKETNPPAPADKWQKLYYRGLDAEGNEGAPDHQSKIRLGGFRGLDGSVSEYPEARVCPIKNAPLPDSVRAAQAAAAAAAKPANVLAWNSGQGGNGSPLIARGAASGNPGLSLALDRIGFDAEAQRQATLPLPAQNGAAAAEAAAHKLALSRRDWIMDVHQRQRRFGLRSAVIPRIRDLSADDFRDLHYAMAQPVVIEGALDMWPALGWTPDYMVQKVGSAPIQYQSDRGSNPNFELDKDRHTASMPFDAYMAAIEADPMSNARYVTAYNNASNGAALAPLFKDVGWIDPYLTRQHGMMWIGPMGTFTPLHFDLTNNLIAQVIGTKHVVMVPPSETHLLYNRQHVFSDVHDITDEARLTEYPLARGAMTYEVDLGPGDLLYVPIGWWHQVTATDFSVTLTYTNFLWPNEGHAEFPNN